MATLILAGITPSCGQAPTRPDASPTFGGYWQQGEPARPHLKHMIANVASPDSAPSPGPYTYTRTQQWPAPAEAGNPDVLIEEQTWRAADGSGASVRQRILVAAGATRPIGQANTHTFAAGGLPAWEAPASNVFPLGGMIDTYKRKEGLSMPGVVAAWNRQHCLDHAQRVAILQIMSDTDGLSYLGTVPDRAGRPGQAFALTERGQGNTPVRDVLIIDGHTGKLLSHEREATIAAGKANPTISYVLFMGCGHTQHPKGAP